MGTITGNGTDMPYGGYEAEIDDLEAPDLFEYCSWGIQLNGDEAEFDSDGFDAGGTHRNGTEYDEEGYDWY